MRDRRCRIIEMALLAPFISAYAISARDDYIAASPYRGWFQNLFKEIGGARREASALSCLNAGKQAYAI